MAGGMTLNELNEKLGSKLFSVKRNGKIITAKTIMLPKTCHATLMRYNGSLVKKIEAFSKTRINFPSLRDPTSQIEVIGKLNDVHSVLELFFDIISGSSDLLAKGVPAKVAISETDIENLVDQFCTTISVGGRCTCKNHLDCYDHDDEDDDDDDDHDHDHDDDDDLDDSDEIDCDAELTDAFDDDDDDDYDQSSDDHSVTSDDDTSDDEEEVRFHMENFQSKMQEFFNKQFSLNKDDRKKQIVDFLKGSPSEASGSSSKTKNGSKTDDFDPKDLLEGEFGAFFYEMMTGQVPLNKFEVNSETFEVFKAITEKKKPGKSKDNATAEKASRTSGKVPKETGKREYERDGSSNSVPRKLSRDDPKSVITDKNTNAASVGDSERKKKKRRRRTDTVSSCQSDPPNDQHDSHSKISSSKERDRTFSDDVSKTSYKKKSRTTSGSNIDNFENGKPKATKSYTYQDYLKLGSEAVIANNHSKAITNLKMAKDAAKNVPEASRASAMDSVIFTYTLCSAYIKSGSYDNIILAINELSSIPSTMVSRLPAVKFLIATACHRLNRFKVAEEKLKELSAILEKEVAVLETFFYPGTNTIIPETELEYLKTESKKLESDCRLTQHNAVAVCRFERCSELSTHIYPSKYMYSNDPDFCGYIVVVCQEKCDVEYHINCWKAYKESKVSGLPGKVTDKDFLGQPCPTMDCVLSDNSPSAIIKIDIYDSQGSIKHSTAMDIAKLKLDAAKRKEKEKQEKEREKQEKQDKEKQDRLEKSKTATQKKTVTDDVSKAKIKVTPAKKPPPAEKKLPVVEKPKTLKKSLFSFENVNKPDPKKLDDEEELVLCLDRMEALRVIWPTQSYIDPSVAQIYDAGDFPEHLQHQESENAGIQTFIWSMFKEMLLAEGVQNVSDIEEKWKSGEEFRDVRMMLKNSESVCDILLKSNDFYIIEDTLALQAQLPDVYSELKTVTVETLRFMHSELFKSNVEPPKTADTRSDLSRFLPPMNDPRPANNKPKSSRDDPFRFLPPLDDGPLKSQKSAVHREYTEHETVIFDSSRRNSDRTVSPAAGLMEEVVFDSNRRSSNATVPASAKKSESSQVYSNTQKSMRTVSVTGDTLECNKVIFDSNRQNLKTTAPVTNNQSNSSQHVSTVTKEKSTNRSHETNLTSIESSSVPSTSMNKPEKSDNFRDPFLSAISKIACAERNSTNIEESNPMEINCTQSISKGQVANSNSSEELSANKLSQPISEPALTLIKDPPTQKNVSASETKDGYAEKNWENGRIKNNFKSPEPTENLTVTPSDKVIPPKDIIDGQRLTKPANSEQVTYSVEKLQNKSQDAEKDETISTSTHGEIDFKVRCSSETRDSISCKSEDVDDEEFFDCEVSEKNSVQSELTVEQGLPLGDIVSTDSSESANCSSCEPLNQFDNPTDFSKNLNNVSNESIILPNNEVLQIDNGFSIYAILKDIEHLLSFINKFNDTSEIDFEANLLNKLVNNVLSKIGSAELEKINMESDPKVVFKKKVKLCLNLSKKITQYFMNKCVDTMETIHHFGANFINQYNLLTENLDLDALNCDNNDLPSKISSDSVISPSLESLVPTEESGQNKIIEKLEVGIQTDSSLDAHFDCAAQPPEDETEDRKRLFDHVKLQNDEILEFCKKYIPLMPPMVSENYHEMETQNGSFEKNSKDQVHLLSLNTALITSLCKALDESVEKFKLTMESALTDLKTNQIDFVFKFLRSRYSEKITDYEGFLKKFYTNSTRNLDCWAEIQDNIEHSRKMMHQLDFKEKVFNFKHAKLEAKLAETGIVNIEDIKELFTLDFDQDPEFKLKVSTIEEVFVSLLKAAANEFRKQNQQVLHKILLQAKEANMMSPALLDQLLAHQQNVTEKTDQSTSTDDDTDHKGNLEKSFLSTSKPSPSTTRSNSIDSMALAVEESDEKSVASNQANSHLNQSIPESNGCGDNTANCRTSSSVCDDDEADNDDNEDDDDGGEEEEGEEDIIPESDKNDDIDTASMDDYSIEENELQAPVSRSSSITENSVVTGTTSQLKEGNPAAIESKPQRKNSPLNLPRETSQTADNEIKADSIVTNEVNPKNLHIEAKSSETQPESNNIPSVISAKRIAIEQVLKQSIERLKESRQSADLTKSVGNPPTSNQPPRIQRIPPTEPYMNPGRVPVRPSFDNRNQPLNVVPTNAPIFPFPPPNHPAKNNHMFEPFHFPPHIPPKSNNLNNENRPQRLPAPSANFTKPVPQVPSTISNVNKSSTSMQKSTSQPSVTLKKENVAKPTTSIQKPVSQPPILPKKGDVSKPLTSVQRAVSQPTTSPQKKQPEAVPKPVPNVPSKSLPKASTSVKPDQQKKAVDSGVKPSGLGASKVDSKFLSNLKNSCFKKLMLKLQEKYPHKTEVELILYLKTVRERNRDSLTGMSFNEIIVLVDSMVETPNFKFPKFSGSSSTSAKPSASIMGLEKFGQSAWVKNETRDNSNYSNEDLKECVVCCSIMARNSSTTLSCKHVFHTHCIREWLKIKRVCPLCQAVCLMPDEYPSLR